jgi:exopolysaccharide biosynthesis polyprenyl glycosylphosphotransferase
VKSDTDVGPAIHQLGATQIGAAARGRGSFAWGEPFWSAARLTIDVALLSLAGVIAAFFSSHSGAPARVLWPVLFGSIVVCMSHVRGTYRRRIKLDSFDDLRSTGWVVAVATSVVVTLQVLFDNSFQSTASHTVRLGLLAAVLVAAGRVALNVWQLQTRRQGKALVPTLIVGAGHVGRTTAKRLLKQPELGLRPVGFLDKEPLDAGNSARRLPVLGASWDLESVVYEYGIGQVIVTFSTAPSDVLLRLVNRCEELGIAVALVPRLFEKMTHRLTIEHLGGLPLITSRPSDPRGWQFAVKYSFDRLVALVSVVFLLPVLAACALAVRLTMGTPILFRQRRVGRDGHEFDMLKFRSMRGSPNQGGEADATWFAQQLDSESDEHPAEAEDDPRVTVVGRVLRKTWLDELPQLFNVLKGDMSLVGPRPERVSYVRHFEKQIYRYGDRHRVKAGITGWAQVHGLRGETSLADRVEWDNYYIENFSLWLDLKIVGWTVRSMFYRPANDPS